MKLSNWIINLSPIKSELSVGVLDYPSLAKWYDS